ncbi:MAG TPA: protein-glutamate O-methyltransferase CheR [Polyangiaceae bacterium]|nr:protein-glutamate O-methyltransferase CheR [Polyangiaceae bacterium]
MNVFDRRDARLRIRPEEFRLLRDLVNEHAGLHFDDSSSYLFDRRLGERVAALDLSGFDEYYKYLRFNVRGRLELEEAVEVLTTNETYFLRQEYQLTAFRDEILPQLAKANAEKRRLVVWSAGCSTGEEAYSIAAMIHQSGRFVDWDVRVVGSDISKRSVAAARRGVYRMGAFRSVPDGFRSAYFTEREDGSHVGDTLRRFCYFGHLNLLDGVKASTLGRVDVVFCRNVLIYFDAGSRRRVIDNLYERLAPGGYLLLGHSESLLNLSTAFELVHLSSDLVYRRPLQPGRDGRPR